MSPSIQQIIRVIVISILLGGASGVIATALTSNYLTQYAFQLGGLTEPLRLTQERPRAVPQVYADARRELEQNALPAVGGVFGAIVPATGFTMDDQRGSLIALTSDGWMLSAAGIVFSNLFVGEKRCAVDRVFKDTQTGLSFLHCEVSGVPVADLGRGYDLRPGDQVFVVDGSGRYYFTEVSQISWGEASVRSADVPARRVGLARSFDVLPGAAVFNISGELVGMIDPVGDGSQVVPFEHIASAFKFVLEGAAQISRATLGVNFIDLARTVGLSENLTRGIRAGALLLGAQAVERGGAAFDAGLHAGDIVLAIDGVFVDSTFTLDDLLTSYAPGAVVRVLFDRAGERIEVDVALGSSVE